MDVASYKNKENTALPGERGLLSSCVVVVDGTVW